MMSEKTKQQLCIKAYDNLGALERILRVIRHRGAHIENLTMQIEDQHIFALVLTCTTERSVAALCNQINKLVDVISVEI